MQNDPSFLSGLSVFSVGCKGSRILKAITVIQGLSNTRKYGMIAVSKGSMVRKVSDVMALVCKNVLRGMDDDRTGRNQGIKLQQIM